ncbi:Protein kinase domain-containing protein [Fusarium sp. LHS14.1]|nr:Protein kinase domain-containing protein [Fusarium sp. LHS14.1]
MARMLRLFSWCCIAPRKKKEASMTTEPCTERSDSFSSSKEKTQHREESISPPSPTSSFSSATTVASRIRFAVPFSFPKMDPADDALVTSLDDKIWQNMKHKDDHCRRFLPDSSWHDLWEANEVEATLRKCRTEPTPDLVQFILEKARKIFAILVTMRQPELITKFHLEDFGQDMLPVKPASVQKMLGANNGSISDFCDKQWWFTSPIFTKNKFKYEFDKSYHLPFTTAGKQAPLGGSNYSTVEKRSIHADHVELWPDQNSAKDESGNPRVAVKKLLGVDQDPADREAKVLEMMRGLQSDHMIKAIAYYVYDGKHHFMFPWAEHGNLWEFWTKGQRPRLERPYIISVFAQLRGLADAIEQLHDKKICRHGDLKPENILCFSQDNNDGSSSPGVRMVITDVGLARDHIERTQFRTSTNTRVSTKRYAGPEMDVAPLAPLSRRFDIWSMGCILLEFVVWMLYGGEELIRCTETPITTFYKVKRDEGEGVISVEIDPTVQGWISYISKDWRCASGTAIERLVHLITDKLLVVNVQDPIEPSDPTEKPEQQKARTHACEMRKGLEDILTDLKTGTIDPIGKRRSNDIPDPQGPSHLASMTQGGLLAPIPHRTRLTDNWIYTPDDTFDVHFLNDFCLATVAQKLDKPLLCHRCRSLSLWSIECRFTDSRSGLDTKARDEHCGLCKLLSYCIRDRKYSLRDTVCFSRVGSYLTVDDGKGQPVVNLCTLPESEVKSLHDVQTGFSTLPDAGSEAHFKVLGEWVRACDSTHHCLPKQLGFIPSRLIHISRTDSDSVRLVERGGELTQPVKYAALSHRWGTGHGELFCTITANIKELKDGFKASNLPKTFLDAVSVTHGLGLEYLWVDSVCIIQDDSEDWNIESKLMEQVFSSAYCTLAASCASGTNDGFLKARPQRRCIPMTFGDATYYACENIDDFGTHVDQSELNQRGWVMQERALSRRTIYFVENQSYWECGGGVRCETMTKMNNRKASFLGDANFPHSAEKYVKGLKIEFFQDLYVRYSKLALSFASDRPVAIKGLENRLLSTFKTTGRYGLIERYLHRSLLWKRGGETLRRIAPTRGGAVPSWSWMAYDGAIDYLSAPGGKVSWSSNIKSSPSQAASQSSHHGHETLALEALVRTVINDPPNEFIFLDEPAQGLTQPMECVVLGSGSQSAGGDCRRHWVVLVNRISNADDSGSEVYERIGVAVLKELHLDFQGPAKEIKVQ